MTQSLESGLTVEQVKKFHEQGYLGPFRALSEEEAAELEENIHSDVYSDEYDRYPERMLHENFEWGQEVLTHDAIVDRITSIVGDDLLLWSSRVWDKSPSEHPIPWHQDERYWSIEPKVTVSAYFAVNKVTEENAAVKVVPGTHRKQVTHIESPEDTHEAFFQCADSSEFSEEDAVSMELEPGEFFLFNEHVVHRTGEHTSDRNRLTMGGRYSPPFVNLGEEMDDLKGKKAVVVSGEDWCGVNETTDPYF